MKTQRYLAVIPLLVALSVNCSDSSGPTNVTVADLVGTWTATQFTITDPSGTVLPAPVDLIGDAFGSLVITVQSNGSFTGTFKATAISESMPVAGTISIVSGILTIDFTDGLDEPISGSFVLNDDELTVTGSNLTFDWEGQNIEGASVILVMTR